MVALSMMVGLAACGSSAGGGSGATTAATTAAATEAPAPAGEAPAGASPTFKIGYNYFGSASYTLMTLANNSGDTLKALDVEYIASDDKFSLEQLVTDVENMIAAGCDGLVLWLPTDTLYATVTEMCKEAQVPFVLNDKLPMDESLIAQISENPYFVGAFGVKNAQYGVALANYVLEQGWKACFITSSNVGDVSDTERMDAFKGIFEAAGGKVFTELHASSSDEALPQIEDALTAYGEQIDFIYGVGGDFGNAACSALENYKGGESGLKVITTGIDQGTLDNFDAGTIAMVNGDYFVNGIVSVIAMVNYLEGNHLVDASGKSPWIYNTASIDINADTNAVFRKVFTQRLCYSDDELRNMTYAYNAGFKYADLEAAIMNYSFSDRVAAAVKAGVITADEAAGAGVK
jgi:ribose transport system substrate-binding protein